MLAILHLSDPIFKNVFIVITVFLRSHYEDSGTPANRKTDKYNILCRNTDTHSHVFILPDKSCTHIVQTVGPIGPFIQFPA